MTDMEKAGYEARIKELRNAIDTYGIHATESAQCGICKVVAVTDDSSALERRLQEEREKICSVMELQLSERQRGIIRGLK